MVRGDSLARAGLLLVAFVLAAPARADKPLVAVLPFTGPHARIAEAVVVRTLRKKAQLVPMSKWNASAKKLFAPSHSAEDISSVAEDVGAVVVVTGAVKRDGRKWQLAISVRDGPTGRGRDKLKYPLKGPRVEARTLALVASEVEQAFDHTLAAVADASGEEPPPTTGKRGKKEPPKVAPVEDEEEEKPQKATDDEKPPIAPVAHVEVKRAPPAGARPRWAPYFDLTAGGTVTGRSWDFTPSSLPHFTSGVVGGLRVDLTLYPLASTWNAARGAFAGLGLGATLEKPFWPQSKGPDGNRYDTSELRVEGGLRWRFVLYKPIPRPELVLLAGGGLHQFAIAKRIDDVTGALTDVGPPDLAYAFVSFGAQLRLRFAEWAMIHVGFGYIAVIDPGPVVQNDEYGPATMIGLRLTGGLDFFVWRGLKVGVAGHYERYALTFTGSDPPPQKPGMGQVAIGALDQYFGGVLLAGYEF